jgi:hypothetical protein
MINLMRLRAYLTHSLAHSEFIAGFLLRKKFRNYPNHQNIV